MSHYVKCYRCGDDTYDVDNGCGECGFGCWDDGSEKYKNAIKRLAELEEALHRIANHDGSRWVDVDGVLESQPSPQEIAREAINIKEAQRDEPR